MLPIQGDTFDMGMDKNDQDSWGSEQPVHPVQVPDFYLAQYLVTQDLWTTVMERDWEHLMFSGARRPIERVSWDDVQEFLDKLESKTGRRFRLPTEAEWEFAARGGMYGNGCKYAGSNRLKEVGWYSENSHGETKPIGRKFPNELGLYDISGNVWEWCGDQWGPQNTQNFDFARERWYRVIRSGSWESGLEQCHISKEGLIFNKNDRFITLGFRLALSLPSVGLPSAAGLWAN